jgi:hypothetical protein
MILVVVALVAVAGILGVIVLQLSGDGSPGSSPGTSPGGPAGASGSPGASPRASGSAPAGASEAPGGAGETAEPGGSTPEPTESPPGGASTTPGATAAALVRCTSQLNGFSIGYPKGWKTVQEDPAWECMLFDREPFTVEPAAEIPPVAVMVNVIATPFDTVYAGITDPTFWEPVAKPVDTKVAGKPAVRLELAATGEGYDAKGTLAYMFLFEHNGNTYVLETRGPANEDGTPNRQDPEYKANKTTLNSMVKSLKLT